MKIIGKLNDGTSLMVVETVEAVRLANLIDTALSVIGKMQDILGLTAPEAVPIPAAEEFRDPPAAKRKPRAKAVKVKKPVKVKKAATGTKICIDCRKSYKPTSNRQQRCVECGAIHKRKDQKANFPLKPDPKAPARIAINDDVKKQRLEMIRKLVKKDAYVPPKAPTIRASEGQSLEDIPEFRQAQREARRE